MASVYRNANGGSSDSHTVIAHDLLGLVDHLHLFLSVEIFLEYINLRNQVESNLIMFSQRCTRQNIGNYRTSLVNSLYLLLQLSHSFLTATRYSLIGGYNYTLNLGYIIKRLQSHNHNNGRAVRVSNNTLVVGNSLWVYLWYNQWYFWVHAESTGVINNYSTSLYSSRCKGLASSAASEESNIHTLEGVLSGLLNSVLLAHELNLLTSRTLGSQHLQLSKWEITLLNQIQEFLTYSTSSTQNSNIVFFHLYTSFQMLININP